MLTRHGWMVAALGVALGIAGRVLGELELILIGVTLVVLVVVCVAYVRLLRLDIRVERELHPPKVHAGSPSRVDLRVENRGRWATPVLRLRDAVSGTSGADLLVGPLGRDQIVRAAYRLPTERRGVLRIGPLDVMLADPLGLSELRLRAAGVSELTVFPHVDEIPPIPQTTGNDPMAGAEHPNAMARAGEDFYALRNYVVGDDLRRVHWPSTARHDELMVRQDELPWQGRATLLVDVRASVCPPVALELVVSAAASIVNAGARRQDLLRLVTTDGTDSGVAAGHGHVEAIMEHLATVQPAAHDAFVAVVAQLARSAGGGALVAVVPDLPRPELEHLLRLRRRFGSLTIVRFDGAIWDPHAASAAPVVAEGVLSVNPGQSFPTVWNAAVRPRRRAVRPDAVVPRPADDSGADDDRWMRRRMFR